MTDMKVQDLMTLNVRTCQPADSLSTPAQLMWEGDCGSVPVVSDDVVVGMITDRDICMATHLRGCRPRDITVGTVMSTAVRSVGPSAELAEAEAIIRDSQAGWLPVVGANRELLGLVSLVDLARASDRRGRSKEPPISEPISEKEAGNALTAICRSGSPLLPSISW